MEDIDPSRLEDLLKLPYTSFCIVLDHERNKKKLNFSYTSLCYCSKGIQSPDVRGFKNGHYGGVLLMPKSQENVVYFSVMDGDFQVAIDDSKTILRLINSNCLFPERRPQEIILEDKIKKIYH